MSVAGERGAAVERGDGRVVPLGDFAQVDVGEGRAVELQGTDAGQVVGDRHRASHGWDVEDFARSLGQALVAHRAVGRSEVDRALNDLLLAAARANRLVIDRNGWLDLFVVDDPFPNKSGSGKSRPHPSVRRIEVDPSERLSDCSRRVRRGLPAANSMMGKAFSFIKWRGLRQAIQTLPGHEVTEAVSGVRQRFATFLLQRGPSSVFDRKDIPPQTTLVLLWQILPACTFLVPSTKP